MIKLALAFITSFVVVLLSTPALIKVSYLKRLVDEPSEGRKVHIRRIPTIGGIMIFAGTLFSYLLWYPFIEIDDFKYICASMLILFFIGVKDDIVGTAPMKKLIGHLIVAFILVFMAEIRITSMYGLFGLEDIPLYASTALSVFAYIVIVNAFNLIDGVDGLASGVGFISCMAFAVWFFMAGGLEDAVLALALGGALLGFLIFNFPPARIFMGDSGSLVIGLIAAVLAIKMIEFEHGKLPMVVVEISKPVYAMAALAYPMVDTLRITTLRILQGRSPFSADRSHLHHQLLDLGLNHLQTSLVVYLFSILSITIAVFLPFDNSINFFIILLFVFSMASLPSILLYARRKKKANES